ncbi:laccase domain-containing protein [Candidatus Berkelbacteria bacterium]|nr:laccase domain-containing protein [Candidatus Berkelbacteria bacterium]
MEISIFTSTVADGNMSYKLGAREQVDQNHERFFEAHGVNPHKVVYMQQAHGDRIGVVKRPQLRKKTDGLISNKPGLWLAVYHADCIPLFFVDETAGAIGVAHVGSRGAIAGLPGKMVAEMVKHFKSDPANITVKFGPFICERHYDVPVDDERTKLLPTQAIKNGVIGLDLKKAVVERLIKAGVRQEHINATAECTAEHPETYWSYHHTREKTDGVMISIIGL